MLFRSYPYAPAALDDPAKVVHGIPAQPGRDVAYSILPDEQLTGPHFKDPGNFNFVDAQSGQVHELGNFLGQGSFSRVYELAGPEQAQAVIKFRTSTEIAEVGVSAADMVANAAPASERLEKAGIPQLRVLAAETEAATPYVIVEKLPKEAKTFGYEATRTAEGRAAAGFTPEHEQAVIKLYQDLADQGLVAQDLKIDNLYFTTQDNRVVAGVLDHDRILPWEEARNSYWVKAMREDPPGYNINSFGLQEGQFTDSHQFMAKMLEAKGWISAPSLFKPGFVNERLSLDRLKGTKFEIFFSPPPGP